MTTRRLGWGLKYEFCQSFISNKIFPNRFVGVDFLNSRRCCSVKVLYSFDVRRFSNTVSAVNVTWRRIRARRDPESLISESDLELLISGKFLISLIIRSFLLIRLCGRSICLVVVEMLIKMIIYFSVVLFRFATRKNSSSCKSER